MIDKRILRPFDPVIPVFKISPALLVKIRVDDVFAVLQHQIVIIPVQRLTRKCLLNTVHKNFKGCSVKKRMMDIEEEIAGLLCLKDPAAEHAAAYDLKGVDKSVLYIFQLEFGQMLYMEFLKDLR